MALNAPRVEIPTDRVFLAACLAPLEALLAREDVTDLHVNRPGALWVETTDGGTEHHPAPWLDDAWLSRLARQVAALSDQGISREHPLLSAALPSGDRVQFVAPPAARLGVALSVRRHGPEPRGLSDFVHDPARPASKTADAVRARLDAHLDAGDIEAFLRAAVHARLNLIVSGGTATGKTTFLNLLLAAAEPTDRLILIEDAPEIRARQPNCVSLLAVRGGLGEARVVPEDLLEAALRMRPDRIILGELRGREAFTFLRAINTGHPGSMTTLHASSPKGALQQLGLMVTQSGASLGLDDVVAYARAAVDVIVQLDRSDAGRSITAVWCNWRHGTGDAGL